MSEGETMQGGSGPAPEDPRGLDGIFAAYVDRLNAGEALDASEVREKHPEHAGYLLERLRDYEALLASGGPGDPIPFKGRKFAGYRIIRELGRGGMGVVYEAMEESMDRRVALKVLPAGLVIDRRSVERFRGEARIAAKLRHPNIVTVYATGLEDGTPYIAMEFVEGETLAHVLERKKPPIGPSDFGRLSGGLLTSIRRAFASSPTEIATSDGPRVTLGDPGGAPGASENTPIPSSPADLDLTYCIRMARTFAAVADGLAHAHSKGIIHRDLKPSNLILEKDGTVRILDFGLARLEGEQGLTGTGEIVGTPRYMSPEQARGREVPVDHRADIYSLGATLYEVLTLTPPYTGRTAQQVIDQIIHREPPSPRRHNPRIPSQLETIVLKCLRKSPEDRYGTAEAFAHDLRSFARGDPIEARPQSLGERFRRRLFENRGRLIAAAAVLAVLGASTPFVLEKHEESRVGVEALYKAQTADAAGRFQMGIFAGEWGRFAWEGLGYDVERLSAGMDDDAHVLLLEDVRRKLEEAARAVPWRPEAHFHLGRLQLHVGEADAAMASFRAASDAGFDAARAILAILLEEKKDTEAASALRQEAGRSGEWPQAECWLAAVSAYSERRWDEAAALYEKLIEMDKSGKEVYPGSAAEIYVSCGLAYLQLGNHGEARACFQKGGALRRGAIEPELLEGCACHAGGDPTRAEDLFQSLFRRTGSNDVAMWVTQLYWLRLDDPEKALSWAERQSPGWNREFWRASCLGTLGRAAEGLEIARKLPELNARAALSYFMTAVLALNTGDFGTCEEMARKAVERAPRSAAPREILAGALARTGRFEEARKHLVEAIELEPDMPSAHYYLGLTLWDPLRVDEARDAFRKSIELGLRSRASRARASGFFTVEDAWMRLGQLEESAGKRQEALDAYAQGVELSKRSGRARADLSLALAASQFSAGLRAEAVKTLDEVLTLVGEADAPAIERRLAEYCRALAPDLPAYLAVDLALEDLARERIIPEGAEWTFHRGRSPPSPGLEWTEPEFDDSGWDRGQSGFGFGDGDDATELPDMRNAYTTLYIRRRFALVPARHSRLLLGVLSDDGFIAYLNGKEVARSRAGAEAAPGHEAVAPQPAPEPIEEVEIELPPGSALDGENVLALLGLNAGRESSDFSLIPVLRGEREPDRAALQKLLADLEARGGGPDVSARQAYLRGRIHQALGEHAAAVSALEIARSLHPSREEIGAALADSLISQGKPSEAREVLTAYLERAHPGTRRAWERWLRLSLVDLRESAQDVAARLRRLPAGLPGRALADVRWQRAEDIRWLFETLAGGKHLRIRCGGGDHAGKDGARWSRDRFFTSGDAYSLGPGRFTGEIEGTEDDALYQTERWFPAGSRAAYEIPLPVGNYRVTLHFAEIHEASKGTRAFDVAIEGETFLPAYRPSERGFATADIRAREARVEDGRLDIVFLPREGNPKISAIEIEPLGP